jgi:hypothetical protein
MDSVPSVFAQIVPELPRLRELITFTPLRSQFGWTLLAQFFHPGCVLFNDSP